jgi:spore germination protein GerM
VLAHPLPATAGIAVVLTTAVLSAASSAPAEARGVVEKRAVSIYAPRGSSIDCARVLPLRRLAGGRTPLKSAMQALLAGPTKAERARGYRGWFSTKTAGHLTSVRISNGVAFIDFRSFARDIPNASTSCGSALLMAQLDRTAKQFPTVKRTMYSFGGSPRAFYEWLQRDVPKLER